MAISFMHSVSEAPFQALEFIDVQMRSFRHKHPDFMDTVDAISSLLKPAFELGLYTAFFYRSPILFIAGALYGITSESSLDSKWEECKRVWELKEIPSESLKTALRVAAVVLAIGALAAAISCRHVTLPLIFLCVGFSAGYQFKVLIAGKVNPQSQTPIIPPAQASPHGPTRSLPNMQSW
jgi:hypothetical protein